MSRKSYSVSNVQMEQERPLGPPKKDSSTVWPLFVGIVAAILLVLFLPTVKSTGESMYPTFTEKELGLSMRVFDGNRSSLKRGDLVAYQHDNKIYNKRLIGLPGDTVEVKPDGVIVNGEKLKEPYRAEKYSIVSGQTYTLGENEYFLMGDNWNNSDDCRVSGPVTGDMLRFKILFHFPVVSEDKTNEFLASIIPEFRNEDFEGEFPEYDGPADYRIRDYLPEITEDAKEVGVFHVNEEYENLIESLAEQQEAELGIDSAN